MKTAIVERSPASPRATGVFEDAIAEAPPREHGSTSALVAMVACNVILLLMLSSCSRAAHAEPVALQAAPTDVRPLDVAVPIERLTVVPSSEDLPPPAKGRWQRFEAALNAGPSRRFRAFEWATNTGVRTACYEPCVMNCCASSGGFSPVTGGVAR